MKTTLRRFLSWDTRKSESLPHDQRRAPYNIRLDQHAHSLNYGLARHANRIN